MAKLGPIASAVYRSLQSVTLEDKDEAGSKLAMRYARLLDSAMGEDNEVMTFARLGPKLLDVLEALGLTPVKTKPAPAGGVEPEGGEDSAAAALRRLRLVRGPGQRHA